MNTDLPATDVFSRVRRAATPGSAAVRLAVVGSLVFVAFPAHADCPQISTMSELERAEAEAEAAFAAMNLPGFQVAAQLSDATLTCLGEPIEPEDAAAYHRVMALQAFLDQDSDRTRNAFRSVLAADPTYELPASLAPPGNPLHSLFVSASDTPHSSMVPQVVPRGTELWVDGSGVGQGLPVDRPVVAQLVGLHEDFPIVLWTGYLQAPADLPDLFALAGGGTGDDRGDKNVGASLADDPDLATADRKRDGEKRGVNKPLMVSAGVAAVASGALFGMSWKYRSKYDDPETPLSELDGLQQMTNAASIGSFGAGVTAVGLGTMAVLWIRL